MYLRRVHDALPAFIRHHHHRYLTQHTTRTHFVVVFVFVLWVFSFVCSLCYFSNVLAIVNELSFDYG
jgi:hypothetical protein